MLIKVEIKASTVAESWHFFLILGCANFILLFCYFYFFIFLTWFILFHFVFVFILQWLRADIFFKILGCAHFILLFFILFLYFSYLIHFMKFAWKKTWCPRTDIRMRRNSVLDYALQKITYFDHVTWKAIWSQDYLLLKNLSLGLRYFHVISNYKGHQKNYSLYTMTFT